MRPRAYLLISTLVLATACGSSSSSGDSAGNSGAGNSSGVGSGMGGAGESVGIGAGTGDSTGTGPSGNEDTCDGIDNDNNGIIDDVDKGKDGICDCLHIATLGVAGEWGEGDVFAAWLQARSDFGATDVNDQVLTPELLAPFQVIVAQDLSKMGRTYGADEVAALSAWVKAGGGFMTLIGYGDPSERTNSNTLLAAFGMSYDSQQILQKQGGNTVPVTGWVPHAITNGVSRVGVDNGYPVQGSPQTLASEQGFDLLKATEVGSGHVLMWGDEWITYDSEWSGHPDYQVELFWLNMIKWLTPANQCQVAIPPDIH